MDTIQQGMWVRTLWDPVKEKRQSSLETEEGIIRVAAYCRVSTTLEEQIRSLENQVSHYTHLIRNKANWKFVGVYVDNGSGTRTDKQRGLQRLLRHCEEGRVDFILTKNISRLSRNAEETLSIIEKLKKLNVGLYFEKEQIDTSVEYNKFLLSTYAALAQEEVETISISTRWGYEKNFKQGIPRYNKMLGYDLVKKDGRNALQINEEGAVVVRKIFDWFLQGMTMAEIARELIQQGIKTSVGKELWRGSTVKHILTNVTYTGSKLTRVRTKDIFTNKTTKNIRDQISIENCHPPIISVDVFEETQKRLEEIRRDKKDTGPRKKRHSLSGRMTCHRCGYRLSNYPTRGVNYWKCNTSDIGVCDLTSVREDILREMLLEGLKQKFDMESPSVFHKLKKALQDINQKDHFEFHRLRWMAELELAKAEEGDLAKLEQEYKAFEKHTARIEDDRPYRNQTLSWLEDVQTVEVFLEQVTIDQLRAWVMGVVIYSSQDYRIEWVDRTETVVGEMPEHYKKGIRLESQTMKKVQKQKEHEPLYQIIDANGHLKGRSEESMQTLMEREVIKIEPKEGKSMLKTIEANLHNHPSTTTANPVTKPLRTAAYCRVSTDREEQLTSYKTQVAYYTYLILKDPRYEFAGIFADEGISGKSLKNRTDFKKLMDECNRGNVNLILCKSISRFSRNTLETLKAVRWLKSLPRPVHIYFEKENIHTKDSDSELMITIFGSIAQEESINIGNSISWGKRSQAERGIIKVGTANYGYRIGDKHQWVIHEEEAKIVRRIYEDLQAGKNYTQILTRLTKDRIPSPKGRDIWSLSTVKEILTNVVYRGDYLYQKYFTLDTLEEKIATNQGELPQYYIEGHHEAIIEPKEWEAVQAIIQERSAAFKARNHIKYSENKHKNEAFIDKLQCGECGNGIGHQRAVERRGSDDAYETHRWVCRLAAKYYAVEGCSSRRFQQTYLEQHFINMLKGLHQNEDFQKEVEKIISKTELSPQELKQEEEAQKRMEQLNHELYEVVDEELHQDGQDSQRVDELSGKIVELHQQLKAFTDRKKLAEQYRNEFKELMKKVKILHEEQQQAFPTELYSQYVEQATIFKDGKVVYHLSIGIRWSTDDRYEEYQRQLLWEKKARLHGRRKEKQEQFLNGPEVKALLEYCEEPRMWGEILEFMNTMMTISASYFRKSIVLPLIEDGKLQKKLLPERQRKHKYYMVKK
ncbi:recombinase family protein [Alkalihalophilus marmarensis]|uniref:recombinase family protein n=1 Tax=Alkalihalophilus marmarensis TaxID=521377 RepID=UPI002E216141|nr:recombinase family protein [Alkalihalophilus marmarensis]MED1601759.1 recombinase family protein [Alkalihalophilus marmarensis]